MDENVKVLDEPTAQFFHHNVTKLLFVQTQSCSFCADVLVLTPRLQLISMHRVKCPDVDDHKKLTRVITYLWNTEILPLV